jgi:hypothetical protein
MSKAMEQIVDAYVRLGNRRASKIFGCIVRSWPSTSRGYDFSLPIGQIDQELAVIGAALEKLDAAHKAGRQLRRPLHTLRFHGTVARRAVKVADIAGADNFKALWNTIHLYVPRIFISRRNPGCAGLSATRAPKIFNPTVAGHP